MRAIIVVGALLVGCGDDGSARMDANPGAEGSVSPHTVDGMVIPVGGGSAPAMSDTIVLWVSDIGQGDFVYKWGQGSATSTTFTADVATPVPTDATFGGMLGVGLVTMVATGTNVPDGVVPNGTFQSIALGYTGEYAVIYRPNATNTTGAPWVDAFPVGLACGKCVHQTTGFDTFEPVSCTTVVLQVGPMSSISGCNWT